MSENTFTAAQITGRMGELFVERSLTGRGWMCGNFNNTTSNTKGWDVFARCKGRARSIRVKASKTTDMMWTIKPKGEVLPLYQENDHQDWIALVSDALSDSPSCYLMPADILVPHLKKQQRRIVQYIEKTNGPINLSSAIHLHLHLRASKRVCVHPTMYGFDKTFAPYLDKWSIEPVADA